MLRIVVLWVVILAVKGNASILDFTPRLCDKVPGDTARAGSSGLVTLPWQSERLGVDDDIGFQGFPAE